MLQRFNSLDGDGASEVAVERATEAAWNLLCRKKGDVSASEIMKLARELVPNIEPARVRFGLARRLRQRGAGW
jgi:hypothetical protein